MKKMLCFNFHIFITSGFDWMCIGIGSVIVLSMKNETSHNLKQYWPSLQKHICATIHFIFKLAIDENGIIHSTFYGQLASLITAYTAFR